MRSGSDMMSLLKTLLGRTVENCPGCGSPRNCAMEEGKSASTCWCMTMLPTGAPDGVRSCLCRACLLKYGER